MGHSPGVRPAVFHKKARQTFKSFPKPVRRELGEAIANVQHGALPGMPLCRPMPTIGSGVYELRVRDSSGIYRAFMLLKYRQGVLIFHAFQKKTAKTPPHEIEVAIRRLKEMLTGGDTA
jgi:phage-related protein